MQQSPSKYNFNPEKYIPHMRAILNEISKAQSWDDNSIRKILQKYPKDQSGFFSKHELGAGYKYLISQEQFTQSELVEERIKMKPTRTISGVATVTVLTKPFPCPGQCIFCPNDVKMPKSYLSDEPGAQRAERNNFDPYLQTYNRLLALKNIGHKTDKVELIILGGTWSFYPEAYQIWFIKQCFQAMNDFGIQDRREKIETENIFEEADKVPRETKSGRARSYNEIIDIVERQEGSELLSDKEFSTWEELFNEHEINETAEARCIGLVIETRPDYIDEEEVIKIRKLGATKVQIGIQTLDDEILMMNRRGHGATETKDAIKLLRRAGFKVHAHWMPNLYGATPEKDIADYSRLWENEVQPDELKIYPTSIIENTELHELFKQGKYRPYSFDELLHIFTEILPETPRFCRLTRIVRDIPSTDIVAGNKLTNFRQIAEDELAKDGKKCECIRCREIKGGSVKFEDLEQEIIDYDTPVSREYFINYKTKSDDKICGFLRLSLPTELYRDSHFLPELLDRAIIREIHVYGKVVGIGENSEKGESQHLGLGTKMIQLAKDISHEARFNEIAVISAIGTREYYRKKGFIEDGLYMWSDC